MKEFIDKAYIQQQNALSEIIFQSVPIFNIEQNNAIFHIFYLLYNNFSNKYLTLNVKSILQYLNSTTFI
jgi:hypothetical protein